MQSKEREAKEIAKRKMKELERQRRQNERAGIRSGGIGSGGIGVGDSASYAGGASPSWTPPVAERPVDVRSAAGPALAKSAARGMKLGGSKPKVANFVSALAAEGELVEAVPAGGAPSPASSAAAAGVSTTAAPLSARATAHGAPGLSPGSVARTEACVHARWPAADGGCCVADAWMTVAVAMFADLSSGFM